MKFSAMSIAMLATLADGFAPTKSLFGVTTSSSGSKLLKNNRLYVSSSTDSSSSSDKIQQALDMTKKYGAASPQARLAWEVVEEMDSADNSQASKGSLETECLASSTPSPECVDYQAKIAELEEYLAQSQTTANTIQQQGKNNRLQLVADTIPPVKLSDPNNNHKSKNQQKETTGNDKQKTNPKLVAAIRNAEFISNQQGITSPEAKVAWDIVEELSANDSHDTNTMGRTLSCDECLVEEMQECKALYELEQALKNIQDISTIHQHALKISQKYGATSNEARLAWEVVEELEYANERKEAMKGSLATECQLTDTPSQACIEYENQMTQMESILEQEAQNQLIQKDKKGKLRIVANVVPPVKLTKPKQNTATPSNTRSLELVEAIQRAKFITEERGITSPAAKVAWDVVEELSSSNSNVGMGSPPLTLESCSLDNMEECKALAELDEALRNIDEIIQNS